MNRILELENSAASLEKFWRGRRVVVTGASGFIAGWLVERLAKLGALTIACVARDSNEQRHADQFKSPNIKLVNGRIDDPAFVSEIFHRTNVDCVFHLAAINTNLKISGSPVTLFDSNVRAVYTLLDAVRVASIRAVVIASSREVDTVFQVKDILGKPSGRRPYQVSKACAELIAQSFHETYDLPVVIARCDNVFGGRDLNWNRLIPGTVRSVITGQAPVLRTSGGLARGYLYIDDLIDGYLLLGMRASEPTLNGRMFRFGVSEQFTALEIVRRICHLVDKRQINPVVQACMEDERVDEVKSFEQTSGLLGWVPMTPLEDGLRKTINWYRQYLQL